MNLRKHWKWIFIAPAALAGMLALASVVFFIGGEVVMRLWNWLLPPIFGVRQITVWQGVGMLVLCRILFGGFGYHGRSRSSWTREEKQRFRQGIRRRCGLEPSASASTEL
jgi:hypothetical protein